MCGVGGGGFSGLAYGDKKIVPITLVIQTLDYLLVKVCLKFYIYPNGMLNQLLGIAYIMDKISGLCPW